MSFVPDPVRPLRQEVETQLREAILSGTLLEGERLPSEPELARMFGVSRSTVREALRSLDVMRLIERVPGSGGGTFVRAVGAEQFSDTFRDSMQLLLDAGEVQEDQIVDVRSMLEVPACRLAALNRSDEDLREMWKIIDQEKSISIDAPQVPELDRRFHVGVARASGNHLLAALVDALHRSVRPVDHLDLRPEVGRATVQQHIALVEAIQDGDPDSAAHALEGHLAYLRREGRREVTGSGDRTEPPTREHEPDKRNR